MPKLAVWGFFSGEALLRVLETSDTDGTSTNFDADETPFKVIVGAPGAEMVADASGGDGSLDTCSQCPAAHGIPKSVKNKS